MSINNINLNGEWFFKRDPDSEMEKQGIQYQVIDKEKWQKISVPAHWQLEGFNYQGTVWYYKSFNIANINNIKEVFIEFKKVDYITEVWLNGVYLGFNEGDFNSFSFKIKDYLKESNELFLKVKSEIDKKPEFKKTIKGGIYHWDCVPIEQRGLIDCPEVPSAANERYPNPLINPGGIWGDVNIAFYSSIKINEKKFPYYFKSNSKDCFSSEEVESKDFRKISSVLLNPRFKLSNFSDYPESFDFVFKITPDNFSGESYEFCVREEVFPGKSSIDFKFKLDNFKRWWIREFGNPNLYKLQLDIFSKEELVYSCSETIAFRETVLGSDFSFYLNGRRFYVRGANYLSSQFLSQSDKDLYDKDLEYMLNANINMLRLFSHLENDYFYEQCDRKGLLIWQDLPFQWGYDNSVETIERAKNVAEKAVNKLIDHPSIFNWCLHSESRYHDYIKLDKVIENKVEELDPGRPIWKNSVFMTEGKPPEYFKSLEEFEEYNRQNLSVNWVGWYWGGIEDAEEYNPLFITEFGTQSLPGKKTMINIFGEDKLWPPDWEEWKRRGFQKDIYEKNIGRTYDSLDQLIKISQAYQSYFYKEHIEAMRRKKYANNNGMVQFHFVSTWPALDWSIIDHKRHPKKAYFAVKESYQKLLPSFRVIKKDKNYILEGWLINDFHSEFIDLELRYRLEYNNLDKNAEFSNKININADSSKKILEMKINNCFEAVKVQSQIYNGQDEISQNTNLLFNNEVLSNFSEKYTIIKNLGGE
jgi:beta-mannosidase